MPSTYPYSQDQFVTHVDNIEYEMAEHMNNVQTCIQAIEAVLGYGTASTIANILWSPEFNQNYPTVAARLAALETAVIGGAVVLDKANGDISTSNFADQPAAGGSGKAADAEHKHGRESLNTDGTLIQPIGVTQAAGSSGKAPDAAHSHVGVASLTEGYGLSLTGGDGSGHGALTTAVELTSQVDFPSLGSGLPLTPSVYTALASLNIMAEGSYLFGFQGQIENTGGGTCFITIGICNSPTNANGFYSCLSSTIFSGEVKTIGSGQITLGLPVETVYLVVITTSSGVVVQSLPLIGGGINATGLSAVRFG